MRQSQMVNNSSSLSTLSGENIKVVVRLRPKLEREYDQSSNPFKVISNKTLQAVMKGDTKTYTFDYIATDESTQSEVFDETAKSICDSVLEGYNGTIFVYGQTSSGKTYTILGSSYSSLPKELNNDSRYSVLSFGSFTNHSNGSGTLTYRDDNRGILPRVFEYLFMQASSKYHQTTISFSCSFLEIYQEQLSDLLDPTPNKQLAIQTVNGSVIVDNLSKLSIKSVEEGYSLIVKGNKLRHIAPTGMNKESSRSHAVFSIYVESKMNSQSSCNSIKNNETASQCKSKSIIRKSVFHIIDLAGSERQKGTEATGERLKEAGMINKSLMQLSFVIKSLSDTSTSKVSHIHYRDSKLTMLLKDSIGGNSKTCIIANINPSYQNINESLSTLSFAKRAKTIKNKAIVNEVKATESVTQFQISNMLEKYNTIKAENFYLLSLLKKHCTVTQSQISLKRRPSENQRNFAITLDSIEEEIEDMLKEISLKEKDIITLENQRVFLKDQLQKMELDYTIKEKEIEDSEERTKAINQAYTEMKHQIIDYNKDNNELLKKIIQEQSDKNQKTIHYNEEICLMKRSIENCNKNILLKDNEIENITYKENEVMKKIDRTKEDIDNIQITKARISNDIIAKDKINQEQLISITRLKDDIKEMKGVIDSKDNDILALTTKINQLRDKGEIIINEYQCKIDKMKSMIDARESDYQSIKEEKSNMFRSLSQLQKDNSSLEITYLNSMDMLKRITTEVNTLKKKRQSFLNGIMRYDTQNETVVKEINLLTEDQGSTTSKINLLTKSKQENSRLKESLNELKKVYDFLLKNVNSSTGNKGSINALAQELVNYNTQLEMKKNTMRDAIEIIKSTLPNELVLKCKSVSDTTTGSSNDNNDIDGDNSNDPIQDQFLFYFNLLYDYDESLSKSLRHLNEEYKEKEEKLANLNKKIIIIENENDDNKENELNKFNHHYRYHTEMKNKRKSEMNSNCIKSQSHLKLYNQLYGFKRKYEDFIPFALYESIDNNKLLLTGTKRNPAPSAINTHQKPMIHIQRLALGCKSQTKRREQNQNHKSNSKNQISINQSNKKNHINPSSSTLTKILTPVTKAKVKIPKTSHI